MEDTKWQTELTTIRERNVYALNNSLFCDVEFSVVDSNGNKVTLQAHKYVLAISSPVFEAMFYGELAETGRTIDLPDCTKEGLQQLLHYVYSDEVNLTGKNVMDVLYVGQKYMLPFLEQKCYECLQKDLEPEDVFIVLPQAQQTKNEKAELCSWNVVDFETETAVMSEPFLEISRELLCEVLARDTLHVEEIDLFKAVDKWASNQIKEKDREEDTDASKRNVLGEDAVRLIRFPVMSSQEFARFVLGSDILITSEINEILKVLCSATTSETSFNSKKREGQWSEKWSANRFETLGGSNSYGEYRHFLEFQVSKPVFLAGVKLFENQGSSSLTLSVSKLIEVSDQSLHEYPKRSKTSSNSSSPRIKHTCKKVTFKGKPTRIDGSYQGYKVLLDDPVPLEPNQWYLIEAEFSGSYTRFAGIDGRNTVKCDDVIITFKDAAVDNNPNSTTVEKGQFPSFLLKRKIVLKETEDSSE